MNVEKFKSFKVKQVVKNYKEMCLILEDEIKGGKSKILQVQDWERYISFIKSGQSFIIEEIYEAPKEKLDGRKDNSGKSEGSRGNSYRKDLYGFSVEYKIGVYKITLDNDIYVGSTVLSFRERYLVHSYKNNPLPTREMLKNGAIFEIIKICDGMTEPQIRDLENIYIEKYRNDEIWNIVNVNNAWSHAPIQKYKTIKFQVKQEDYEETMKILKNNGLVS